MDEKSKLEQWAELLEGLYKSKTNRRKFLQIFGAGAAATATTNALDSYLDNVLMVKPPAEIIGEDGREKILFDLHVHLSRRISKEDQMKTLTEGYAIGLAKTENPNYLTYEEALKLPFDEIKILDEGLASVTYNGKTGYVLRAQELMSDHHILAVECNEYIDVPSDAIEAVEEIHIRNGIAILAHPLLKQGNNSLDWGYVKREDGDIDKVKKLCEIVDEIEKFNAFSTLFPRANQLAYKLVKTYRKKFKGVAVSDAHYLPEQVGMSGIYLDKSVLDSKSPVKDIMDNVTSGNFQNIEQYISRRSIFESILTQLFYIS